MTQKKDYLSELSKEVESKGKLESFQEEKVTRVEKPKRHINPVVIVGAVVGLAVALGLGWFLFLRPSIEMPNFVGKTQNDVGAWAKQQGVATSGIIFMEEFNFDYDNGQIASQSVEEGTNVGKDAKITFVLSKGANPDEKVALPDIASMNQSELKEWISKNKLTKTKITTEFSDTVEKDEVISFDLKNVDANDFTRGTTLTIKVSKGPQPAGTVTVEDFKDKDKAFVESWAKGKKVQLNVEEVYHDTVAKGLVISQSVESGKTMKEKEALTITVSKGKAISLPDFTKMNKEDLAAWKQNKDNSVIFVEKERYTNESKHVLEQSPKAGTSVESGDVVTLTISIGKPRIKESYIGKSIQDLVDWTNAERHKGADMFAGEWGTTPIYSNTYRRGQIINIVCADSKGNTADCANELPLDARFTVTLSKGLSVTMKDTDLATTETIVDFLASKQFQFTTRAGTVAGIEVDGVFYQVGNTSEVEVREDSSIIVIL